MDFQLFIPITKIDVAQRLVFGTIAEEIPDHAGEIMDYESAKPEFEAWSAEISKASNGRSVGNLRAMHGSIAAGKLDQIHFDDDAKRIATVAKVVDDAEWKKVVEGVYTGFSMGGRYMNRWPDPENPELTRYTPKPLEVSLVDHPCIPSATFEVVKADGSVELRKFRRSTAERDVSRDAAEFADPGYQADGKKRYPLDTEAHIRAAWAYIHHPKNRKPYSTADIARIKAKIVAAWKVKIDKAGPPLAAGKAAPRASLAKDLGDVSQLALIIDELAQISASSGNTADPALQSNIANLVELLNSLVAQAVSGLNGQDDLSDASPPADDDVDDDDYPDDDDDSEADSASADDSAFDDDRSNDDGLIDKRAIAQELRQTFTKTFAPRFATMSAQMSELAKRLERIEAQPMPGGPVAKFVTVTKTQDMGGAGVSERDPLSAFQTHLEQLAPGERAHVLTKLALRNPLSGR